MFKMQTGIWKSSTMIRPNGKTIKKKDAISTYENNKVKIIKRATSVDPDAKIFKVFEKKIDKVQPYSKEENQLKNKVKAIILRRLQNKYSQPMPAEMYDDTPVKRTKSIKTQTERQKKSTVSAAKKKSTVSAVKKKSTISAVKKKSTISAVKKKSTVSAVKKEQKPKKRTVKRKNNGK